MHAHESDQALLAQIVRLASSARESDIGDSLVSAVGIAARLTGPAAAEVAEGQLHSLRSLAARAQVGWPLFAKPMLPSRGLTDIEVLQLFSVERVLHEFCFACETLEETAALTWGGSTPTRFYLNSIYHYASSLFLIDKSKENHRGLPLGGNVILALHPMGLAQLLDPVNAVLSKPFGNDVTLGDAILRLRHSYLVHGELSPANIEYLVGQTSMRDPRQQALFASLVWQLFHQVIILDLRVVAILSHLRIDIDQLLHRYMTSIN